MMERRARAFPLSAVPAGLSPLLDARQHQFRPKAADRCIPERKAPAVEAGEIDHDREPQPGTRLRLVEPLAAPQNLGAFGGR